MRKSVIAGLLSMVLLAGCGAAVDGVAAPGEIPGVTTVTPTAEETSAGEQTPTGEVPEPATESGTAAFTPTTSEVPAPSSAQEPSQPQAPDPALVEEITTRMMAGLDMDMNFRVTGGVEPETDEVFVGEMSVAVSGEFVSHLDVRPGGANAGEHLIYVDYVYYYRPDADSLYEKVDSGEESERLDEFDEMLSSYVGSVGYYESEVVQIAQDLAGPEDVVLDGVDATRYVVTVRPGEAADLAEALGEDELRASMGRMAAAGVSEYRFELTYDDENRLLNLVFRFNDRTGEYVNTEEYAYFDDPESLNIVAPPADRIQG